MSTGAQEPTAAITTIGVVTRNRVTSLVACVESYWENCRRHGRAVQFVVTDDASGTEAQDQTRAALQLLANRVGAPIRYAGSREKSRFGEALARESTVPLEIIRFALAGDDRCALSTGANRNSLLLDTVGSLVFSADDDTSCRIAPAPDRDEVVSIFPGYDPTEFWFFPDRMVALQSIPFTEVDFLGPHDALLGKALADVTASPGIAGHVAITMQGLIGDSGMASPRYYFTLTGASRERFVVSEEAYRSALRSREILRTVRRPTISAASFCMTTFFGFDNRALLPPFFPVQRNSDGIFGLVLQTCCTDAHVAFLPWALVHAPPESREFVLDDVWADAESVRMADVVVDCMLAHPTNAHALPDATRLSQLGAHLQQIGSLPLQEFEVYVRNLQQHRAVAFTALLSSRLHEYGASPSFWAADVERLIERLAKAPTAEHFVVPRDLRGRPDVDATRRLSQDLVAQFGRLLEAWPAIVEAATRLRAKGYRLTRPVQGSD